MKSWVAAVFLVLPVLTFAGPAIPEDSLIDNQEWSWGLGRFSYQFEAPLGRPGAVGRSELSLVHLEYRWPRTPLSVEAEILNTSGLWTGPVDGVYSWAGEPTLPPLVLWWAQALPDFPPLEAGPYLSTGENLNLRTPEASTFRVAMGLQARLSARLGGYRPYFSLHVGLDQKGQLVTGGSLELGGLVAGMLALLVLGAQNSAPR